MHENDECLLIDYEMFLSRIHEAKAFSSNITLILSSRNICDNKL